MLNRWPAWIGEAEQPGDLVERLSGGVIQGSTEPLIGEMIVHQGQFGVAARDDQGQQWEFGLGFLFHEPNRVNVRLEVVDAQQRQPPAKRHTLGHVHADNQ